MVKPPHGAGGAYPAATPPEVKVVHGDPAATQAPVFKQSIFNKMAAAYKS